MYSKLHYRRKIKYNQLKQHKKLKPEVVLLCIGFLIILIVLLFNPMGLIKLIHQKYKIKKISTELDQLKLKAELIEAKIDKLNNDEYLKKFLQDFCKFIPIDSVTK
ncbi:MAG: hypothetical protein NZ601_04430 [candidate division WOR-3 bacterium]|nr:hypothetical protein [candidate division WOR-3 bacterium]MCX7757028.1 hypothetical protein [candidate division WOR-3 bacterium]MDW7987332.1 hypothetical protein [candidate division WOR-3 bacterium]